MPDYKSSVFSPTMKNKIDQHRDLFTTPGLQPNEFEEPESTDVFGRRRIVVDGRCWVLPDEFDDIQTGFPLVSRDMSCQRVNSKTELEKLVRRVLGDSDQ